MNGPDHVITSAASLAIGKSICDLSQRWSLPWANTCLRFEQFFMPKSDAFLAQTGWFTGGVILFFFGSLFPDIDTGRSTIRKMLHMYNSKDDSKNRHRTWTHCIWTIILLWVAAYFVPIFSWFALGYTLHVFWDSFSTMGVCLFYPFQKYIKFDSGARIANGHKLKLYKTNDISEYIIVGVIVAVALLLLGFTYVPGFVTSPMALG